MNMYNLKEILTNFNDELKFNGKKKNIKYALDKLIIFLHIIHHSNIVFPERATPTACLI